MARFQVDATHEAIENRQGTLFRLMKEFKPAVRTMIISFMVLVVSTITGVLSPKILGDGIDIVFTAFTTQTPVDTNALVRILALLMAIYTFTALANYGVNYVLTDVVQSAVLRMRNKVKEKIDRLPLSHFDRTPTGDTLSRLTNDLDTVANTLREAIVTFITATITLVGVTVVMFIISPTMALLVLITLPLTMLATTGLARISRGLFFERQVALGALNSHIEEAYSADLVVKASCQQPEELARFTGENDVYYDKAVKGSFVSGLVRPLVNLVGNLDYVAIVGVGAYLIVNQTLTLGSMQAILQYRHQFVQPLMRLAAIINEVQSALAASERVFNFLDLPEMTPDTPVTLPPSSLAATMVDATVSPVSLGRIEFKDVSFSYIPGVPTIENFNLTVNPGEMVALVGATGAGKSTLVNLLMRFYEVNSGEILLDGKNIAHMRREDVRSHISMVLQDVWLMRESVADNIRFGAHGDDVTDVQVRLAADRASATNFIEGLPQGFETVLDEEGSSLSSGQKQLLTIARALVKDPDILILDEATSSVDARTEKLVQEAIRKALRGRTSFVIAHRLSTIQAADHIVVMDQGRIVEQGTHQELLKSGGYYAALNAARSSL